MDVQIDGVMRTENWIKQEQGRILWWQLYICANRYALHHMTPQEKIDFCIGLSDYLWNRSYLDQVFFGKWDERIRAEAEDYYLREEDA